MSRREYSLKDYMHILTVEKLLLHWSGFVAGWLVFMYYWVFLLWDADIAVIPSVTIGLLGYIFAYLFYDRYFKARQRRYDDVIDLLYPPYWDLVISMLENDREKALKAIDGLSAYVNPGG